MKTKNIGTILIMLSVFITAEVFGLYVTQSYVSKDIPYGIEAPDVEEAYTPWTIITGILVATVILYLMLKYKLNLFVRIWYVVAVTICLSITFSLFIGEIFALIIAFMTALIKIKEKDLYFHNITEIMLYAGLVVIFSPIFNITTAIILLIAISVYDIIAVFGTKHMIVFAKRQSKLGFFPGLIVQYKKEVSILGGGDVGFTLFFATVVSRASGINHGLMIIAGAVIGLLVIFIFGKKKKFYPAMPFISAGMFLMYFISSVLFA
ncbi:MAG: presenilin family intramembrane aspartyl protease [Candidatus Nanoarchaeia archaeon]|nr:presenilin family intramembrane aspartyl protease [Candidatus Nanoarchaeia archaeon]